MKNLISEPEQRFLENSSVLRIFSARAVYFPPGLVKRVRICQTRGTRLRFDAYGGFIAIGFKFLRVILSRVHYKGTFPKFGDNRAGMTQDDLFVFLCPDVARTITNLKVFPAQAKAIEKLQAGEFHFKNPPLKKEDKLSFV